MRIEIVNKEGESIVNFDLETNPFKIGETINVEVSNRDQSFWTTKEVKGDFIVEKIEHFLRMDYSRSQKVFTYFTVSVQVFPI